MAPTPIHLKLPNIVELMFAALPKYLTKLRCAAANGGLTCCDAPKPLAGASRSRRRQSLVENIGDMLLRTVDRSPVKPLRLGPVDI
jgi:hypothetical protein